MGIAASVLGGLLLGGGGFSASAQAAPTNTPVPGASSPIVTAQEEGANVRSGPSSIIYPVLGRLSPGETAPAIAVSPHHEWIEIQFNGTTGWVYTAFVTLSPGFLPEVEPPPTPTPLATATIDPTLAAAFAAGPTATRLPTFTPPPPLVVPTFAGAGGPGFRFPMGLTISLIVLIGAAVLGVSFIGRR
ncbi:MAG: SH3 domain-containing protein [Anaerolineae bacterium]